MKIFLSKIGAARRQLLEAINLFFEERDPVSIHTLIGASLGILHDHFDMDAAWDSNLWFHPKSIYIKEEFRDYWIKKIRKAQNYFKHADRDLAQGRDEIEFETDMNIFSIIEAIKCLRILEATQFEFSPEFDVFMKWVALKFPQIIKDNSYTINLVQHNIDPNDFQAFRIAIQLQKEHPELANQVDSELDT
jgi:hypothetical protein